MKTIRVLRNLGQEWPGYFVDQIVEVDDDLADRLLQRQLAELIRAVPPEPLKTVPENPSIIAAEQKLAEIKDRWTSGKGMNEPVVNPPQRPKRHPKTKPESKET